MSNPTGLHRYAERACAILTLLLLCGSQLAAQPLPAKLAFEDHFVQGLQPQWFASKLAISTTPAGQQRYLGPFGAETVQLNLADLPAHQFVRVSIDVLAIRTWDGIDGSRGPDVFSVFTDDGRLLNCTSFSWYGPQAFPGFFSVHTSPPSGATLAGTLGFLTPEGDDRGGVFHLECVFPHTQARLSLRFVAGLNSDIADEAWGLGRVQVSLDGVSRPDSKALADAWDQLGSDDPAAANRAVWQLAAGGEQAVALLKEKLGESKFPAGVELLEPSHVRLRPIGATPAYALPDAAQRRLALAGHVLQIIGSDAARDLIAQCRPAALTSGKSIPILVKLPGGEPAVNYPLWAQGSAVLSDTIFTDSRGQATVELPGEGNLSLIVQTGKSAYVPLRASWRSTATPKPSDKIEFQLERGTTIGGTVVDDAGQPVEGATVVYYINRKATDAGISLNLTYNTTKTDSAGKWSMDLAPAQFDSITIGVYHPRYVLSGDSYFAMEPVAKIAELRDGTHRLTLQSGVPIEGVVSGADGKPIRNARVGIGADRVASNVMPEQFTDAQGRFVLAGREGQHVTLTAKAEGYAPQLQEFILAKEPGKVQFDMQPAQTLKGRVVDSLGNGITGATVAMDTWRNTRTLNVRLTTDADGNFSWDGAPADAVQADVFCEGYGDNRRISIAVGQANIITLKSPTRFAGTVVDDETGQPIKEFTVVRGIDFRNGQQPMIWERSSSNDPSARGRDGKFERTMTYPYPGYAFRVEALDYLPGDSPSFEMDGTEKSFEFRLKKGESVKGMVQDAAGAPLADAIATLVGAGQSYQLTNGIARENDMRAVSTRSGADGSFRYPPQKDNFVLLITHDKGFALIESADLLKEHAPIKLDPWAIVEGDVSVDSKPGAGARVMGWSRQDNIGLNDPTKPRITLSLQGAADKDGHFKFDRVPPGAYQMGRSVEMGRGMSTTTNDLTITPKAGEKVSIKLGN